jgi:hypothetical protein
VNGEEKVKMPTHAKATVDLTPLKKGTVECSADISFNALDQPESITIVVGELKAEEINHFSKDRLVIADVFGKAEITALLDDGDKVTGQVALIRRVSFGPGEVSLECYLGDTTCSAAQPDTGKGSWVFSLANYRITVGDVWTEIPAPKNYVTPEKIEKWKAGIKDYYEKVEKKPLSAEEIEAKYKVFEVVGGSKRFNRIKFVFGGREWMLDDDLFGRWPKEDSNLFEPIRSGTLATERKEGDSNAALQQTADDITTLLSLALARDVKWVQFGSQLDDGSQGMVQHRKPPLLAFNQNWFTFVDNWKPGNLKHFLESAQKVFLGDREWWMVTIGLLTQVNGSNNLVVKCSLLNTLLDRITSKVNGESSGPEIDAQLDKQIDAKCFRFLLHHLLKTLTPKWDRYRTDAVCDDIKGWNREPSFPNKVIRSCETLGIKGPARSKIGFRHKLIHAGEFDKKLKTMEKKAEYLIETDAVVLMLLIRLLEFDGYIYLQSNAPNHRKVAEFLAATP